MTTTPLALLQFGASGQLGQELLRASANENDIHLTILSRAEADFANPNEIEAAVLGAPALDAVINAVAYTAVDRAESEQALAWRINAETVERLARACQARQVPLIHVSTDYVYDGSKAGPYVESDGTNPINVYGQTKLAGEEMIRTHLAAHVILRTSWLFGASGQNFVKTMLRLGAERDEIRVVDDQWGSPTSARDLAGAILEIARQIAVVRDARVFGTYHFAGSGETTWRRFAEEIFRQAGPARMRARIVPIPSADYPTPARRPANSRLNTDKIRATFGISPPSWQTSLATMLAELGEIRR